MAWKDYYVVLGIPRDESTHGIRKAFRDLALQHHPDRAGPGGTPTFREVVEAYRVLSDPEQRRRHDATLRADDPVRVRVRRPPTRERRFAPVDLLAEPEAILPSAEALLDRLLRNFAAPAKGEHLEPLCCDVALSRAEAHTGGILPIRIPVATPCPRCRGMRHIAGFPCRSCDATGRCRHEVLVPLEVPAGVQPGTVLEVPLDRWGVRNLWLRARIGVAD